MKNATTVDRARIKDIEEELVQHESVLDAPSLSPSQTQKKSGTAFLLFATFVFLYVPYIYNHGFYYSIDTPDLSAFYWGARTAFDSQRSPYNPALTHRLQQRPRATRWPQNPFLYPPPALLMLYPLSLVSYHAAQKALLALSHISILLVTYFSVHQSKLKSSSPYVLFGMVYLFNFQPVLINLDIGQINLIVTVLIWFFWSALKSNKGGLRTALPLAASTILKIYPAVLVPLLLINRRFKAFGWYSILLVLAVAISYFVLPPSTWPDWIAHVLPAGGYGITPEGLPSVASAWNLGVNGFTSRLFLESKFAQPLFPSVVAARVVPEILCFLIVVVTLHAMNRSLRKLENGSIDHQFGALLVGLFLIVPLAWEATLVLLLPAIFIALSHLRFASTCAKATILASIFLLAWPIPFYSEVLRSGWLTLLISTKFFAALLLWVYFTSRLLTRAANPDHADYA